MPLHPKHHQRLRETLTTILDDLRLVTINRKRQAAVNAAVADIGLDSPEYEAHHQTAREQALADPKHEAFSADAVNDIAHLLQTEAGNLAFETVHEYFSVKEPKGTPEPEPRAGYEWRFITECFPPVVQRPDPPTPPPIAIRINGHIVTPYRAKKISWSSPAQAIVQTLLDQGHIDPTSPPLYERRPLVIHHTAKGTGSHQPVNEDYLIYTNRDCAGNMQFARDAAKEHTPQPMSVEVLCRNDLPRQTPGTALAPPLLLAPRHTQEPHKRIWMPISECRPQQKDPPPSAIRFDNSVEYSTARGGKYHQAYHWSNALYYTAVWLYETGRLTPNELPVGFGTSKPLLTAHEPQSNLKKSVAPGVYIDLHHKSPVTMDRIRELLKRFQIDTARCQIKAAPQSRHPTAVLAD